ncbi:GNAT family N-acetyltransferase [Flavobacterium sp. LS1R49]|uniref:GNAT family N-acetyltransferase n=1 Tax=Flavobacterium shii TaxID=2987687 RepID=A0A9X2Z920_9FLAO|nr:GNAT family N-acetyltransferase [Flavobacterium shii]MCV9926214.1 GNAT family N-acetyltransferase [Flavobacterium shii]
MNNIIIRSASPDDMGKLLFFEQELINAERPFDPTLNESDVKYYDIDKMIASPDIELLVAELDGEIIGLGYARIENSKPFVKHVQYGYLGFMYVDPKYRGLGVIHKIIERLIVWTTSREITELRLDVYQANESAIKAYQKLGFTSHYIQMRKEI